MSYLEESSLPSTLGMYRNMLNFLYETLVCEPVFCRWMVRMQGVLLQPARRLIHVAVLSLFLLSQNWIMTLSLSLIWRNAFLLTTKAWQTGKFIDFCEIVGFDTTAQCEWNSSGLENQYGPRKVRVLPRHILPSYILCFVVIYKMCHYKASASHSRTFSYKLKNIFPSREM